MIEANGLQALRQYTRCRRPPGQLPGQTARLSGARIGEVDHRQVGAVLAAAFAADPVWQWVLQGDGRSDRLARAFTATAGVVAATPGAQVLLSPAATAAALWFGPGSRRPPLRASLPRAATSLSALRGGSLRAARLQRVLAGVHPVEPHWYLEALGALPKAQRTGAGVTVLEPVLRLCDARRLPVYLESSNPRNWSFYERHGFQQTAPVPVPDGCPPMMAFRRSPR